MLKKYKTVQSTKVHFLEHSQHAQLYTCASDGKDVRNIPGSHFVKAFSAPPSYS